MARKSKKQQEAEGVVVLIAIAGGILMFLWEHKGWVILILLIIAGIRSCLVRRQTKLHRMVLDAHYDRERLMDQLGGREKLEAELTEKITRAMDGGPEVTVGRKDPWLDEFHENLNAVFSSKELKITGPHRISYCPTAAFPLNRVSFPDPPLVVRMTDDQSDRYFEIAVIPEALLVVYCGPQRRVFLGAFDLQLFRLSVNQEIVRKTVVVHDQSQLPIEDYAKYNPVPEAPILSSQWTWENKDGKRSFRGGMLPKNNPLLFDLSFAQVTVQLGALSSQIRCSRLQAAVALAEIHGRIGSPGTQSTRPAGTKQAIHEVFTETKIQVDAIPDHPGSPTDRVETANPWNISTEGSSDTSPSVFERTDADLSGLESV